ncbi:MAG TPA: PEGA domain-containing protein [Polyangiaceae bacterium]
MALVTLAGPAVAEPTEADRATARALALEGHSALQRKDYAKAADRFGRANALVHAPTLVVDWARALQGLGRFVEAHEKYELVLREGVDASSPKSWTRALEEAKKELEALKPRLGWVTVVLLEPREANVAIDGVPIPPAALGVKRAADPGFPEVTVSAAGYESFKQTVTVGPGEEKSLEVSLRKAPELAEAPPANAKDRSASTPDPTQRTVSYVVLGVGGAGLVLGAVTGVMTLQKRSDLESECINGVCSSASQKTVDSYHKYGTISAVSLSVGVVGVGAGLALFFTAPKGDSAAAGAAAKRPRSADLTWRPVVGLGMLGAEGTFQ